MQVAVSSLEFQVHVAEYRAESRCESEIPVLKYEAGVGQPEQPSFLLRDEILRWAYAEIDAKSD